MRRQLLPLFLIAPAPYIGMTGTYLPLWVRIICSGALCGLGLAILAPLKWAWLEDDGLVLKEGSTVQRMPLEEVMVITRVEETKTLGDVLLHGDRRVLDLEVAVTTRSLRRALGPRLLVIGNVERRKDNRSAWKALGVNNPRR